MHNAHKERIQKKNPTANCEQYRYNKSAVKTMHEICRYVWISTYIKVIDSFRSPTLYKR